MYLFFEGPLVACVFQGICPFSLSHWIYRRKVIHHIPILSNIIHRVYSAVTSLILAVDNLCPLSFLTSMTRGLSISSIPSVTSFAFIDFLLFSVSISFVSSYFYYLFYFLITFVLICSSFYSCVRWKPRSLIWGLSLFLTQIFKCCTPPPTHRCSDTPPDMTWCVFTLIQLQMFYNFPFHFCLDPWDI